MDLKGIVRSLTRFALGADLQLSLSEHGSVQVVQLESPLALLAAHNRRYVGTIGAATKIAPITAWPTTTATFLLYNGEPDGGRSYFIDTVGFWLHSGTSDANGVLLGAVTREKFATIPTTYSTALLYSLSGGAVDSKAVFAQNVTMVSTPAWFALGTPSAGAVAADSDTIGANSGVVDLHGGVAVAPGHGFAFALMSGAGSTPLYGYSITWSELKVTLA